LSASTFSVVLLFISSSTLFFSSGPTTMLAVLLYLRQHLVKRLRAGVVDFQLSARVGAGGCHGLRLRGRLSRGLCRLLLRLFCCCGRSWCRLRLGRSLAAVLL
jgi:hypothetical protein